MATNYLTNEAVETISSGSPNVVLTNEAVETISSGSPNVVLTNFVVEIMSKVNATPVIPNPTLNNNQSRILLIQVFRNGNWVDIPVRSASARLDKAKAGQLTLILEGTTDDEYRAHLYEGEKIRAFRGLQGSPLTRSWTGFVDAPTSIDEGEISRSVIVTDNMQELNTSILVDGHVFDNLDPMYVCASVVQNAIDTGQYIPSNDTGTPLTGATTNFSSPTGNGLCYFPELFNLDGSLFNLASGQLGSYTSGPFAYASMSVPFASGTSERFYRARRRDHRCRGGPFPY